MPDIEIHPATPDRWNDLQALFGNGGASNGCWCVWFRQTSEEHAGMRGEPNRQALCEIIEAGPPPGLLA